MELLQLPSVRLVRDQRSAASALLCLLGQLALQRRNYSKALPSNCFFEDSINIFHQVKSLIHPNTLHKKHLSGCYMCIVFSVLTLSLHLTQKPCDSPSLSTFFTIKLFRNSLLTCEKNYVSPKHISWPPSPFF